MARSEANLTEVAVSLLGGELVASRRLAGGDLSEVVVIELTDGRTAVAKGGPNPVAEAGMLTAIRDTGAAAPAVLACDASVLVLEHLPSDVRLDSAWPDLGRQLGLLHGACGSRYGWHANYAFGAVAIENSCCEDWPSFWASNRLGNQIDFLPADIAGRVSALVTDLPNRLPRHPARALLHGDLWGGNVLAAGGLVTGLIDPACYYGDREVDFAMLQLFDRPDPQLFEYAGPLEPGHEQRLPIYQLWPAIVHLRLFGSAYRPLVERLLGAAGV